MWGGGGGKIFNPSRSERSRAICEYCYENYDTDTESGMILRKLLLKLWHSFYLVVFLHMSVSHPSQSGPHTVITNLHIFLSPIPSSSWLVDGCVPPPVDAFSHTRKVKNPYT